MKQLLVFVSLVFPFIAAAAGCRSCNPCCYTASRACYHESSQESPATEAPVPVPQERAPDFRPTVPAPLSDPVPPAPVRAAD